MPRPRFAAVAFDYFVLFDPDSIVAAVDRVLPGKGRELTDGAAGVELTNPQRRQLVEAYLRLSPWPDTAEALRRLRDFVLGP